MDSSVFQNKIFFLSFSPLNAFQKNTMLYSTVNLKFSITRVTLTGKKKKGINILVQIRITNLYMNHPQ